MELDLLATKNTALIGLIGEYFAEMYLGREKGLFCSRVRNSEKLEPWVELGWLDDEQVRYLSALQDGPTWSWDFVGCNPHTGQLYLIEVKTSRIGKRYGLKGSWWGRSRRAWDLDDTAKANCLGFRLLLINVQFLDNWRLELTEREIHPPSPPKPQ